MLNFKKALIGTAAVAAMAVSATPAMARDGNYNRDHDGIGAGEIIAGAIIIGGIAALAGAFDGDKDRYDDRNYNDNYDYQRRGYNGNYGYNNQNGYNNGNGSRQAVNQCVNAASQRAGNYGQARVTDIRDIDRTRNGYKVEGRVQVQEYRRGNGYGNSWGNNRNRTDTGTFTCYVERGRVTSVRVNGLG